MKQSMATLEFAGLSLAKQRKVAGLTQAELAVTSKVSRATIAAIENGAADPKLTTIISICNGISPSSWGQFMQEMLLFHLEQRSNTGGIAAVAGGAGVVGSTATTGAAISSLSGAALTNASLAALGGGALAAGGGGMAAGTAVVSAAGTVVGAGVSGRIAAAAS